jgi:hypothetical protein
MRFVIFGGGCYGSFYARQLLRAAEAGRPISEVVVVDRNEDPPARSVASSSLVRFVRQDWDEFCDQYFGSLPLDSSDQIVPPPFTPHLPLRWLLRRLPGDRPDLSWSLEPLRRMPGTPFQHQSDHGPLTVSHADWICPVHCVEPQICPVTRGPRYWDMARTVETWAVALGDAGQKIAQIHLFQCLHFSHGVGTYGAAAVARARRELSRIQAGAEPARSLVGTVSRCHGAINLIKAEAGTDTVSSGRESSQLSPT